MLPFFEQPSWHFGPLTIHAFGIAVAAAMAVSLSMADRRFERHALDPLAGKRLGAWTLVGGIIGAHFYSVLLYFPGELRTDPWLLVRLWADISSVGGMLGGTVGAALWFATRGQRLDARTRLAYLDAIAFVFPFGLALGRVGCAMAHDHPGVVTTFPLAISLRSAAAQAYIRDVYEAAGGTLPSDLASRGFHDLGLYELLFLALVMLPLFLYWDRRRRVPGFYLVSFAALYFPVRFALDGLRVADARYLRLTPAQWAAALIMAGVPLAAMGRRRIRFVLSGAVILGTAWACWGGPR